MVQNIKVSLITYSGKNRFLPILIYILVLGRGDGTMVYLQVKLDQLANGLRVLKNASAILYIIATTDERGKTLYESLKKMEDMVKDIDDELLLNFYNNIFKVFLSGAPQQQIVPDDYFAFLRRLGDIINQATDQANEAHLALREAIGPEAVIGKWNGKG